jgi:hypothetical protein
MQPLSELQVSSAFGGRPAVLDGTLRRPNLTHTGHGWWTLGTRNCGMSAVSGLLPLDVCRLDDRPPFLDLGLLQSAKRLGRLLPGGGTSSTRSCPEPLRTH